MNQPQGAQGAQPNRVDPPTIDQVYLEVRDHLDNVSQGLKIFTQQIKMMGQEIDRLNAVSAEQAKVNADQRENILTIQDEYGLVKIELETTKNNLKAAEQAKVNVDQSEQIKDLQEELDNVKADLKATEKELDSKLNLS